MAEYPRVLAVDYAMPKHQNSRKHAAILRRLRRLVAKNPGETLSTEAVCEELGIGFVPFSPLGKGFLTGAIDAATR